MEEKEYKVMLNLEKYNELFNQFDWETYIRQCNYYYDSKSFWANTHGYTVRVRKIEDNIILQIKSPNTSKEAYKAGQNTEWRSAVFLNTCIPQTWFQ